MHKYHRKYNFAIKGQEYVGGISMDARNFANMDYYIKQQLCDD